MNRRPTPDILADAQPATDAVAAAMGTQATEIPVSLIRLDGGTQNRAQLDWVVIAEYSELMKNGARFPAVDVTYDGDAYWLVDGFHRVNAAKDAKRETILADVKPGTLEDAQWRSYSVNTSHGLRRTNEDKRRAVEAALTHPKAAGRSNEQIAQHCGVSAMTVGRYRSAISNIVRDSDPPAERTVTRGDSTYTMQTANIGKQPPAQKQFLEIWQLEQLVRRYLQESLQPEHRAGLLEKIDQWQYREQIASWIDRQESAPIYRPRDLVQAGKNVLEQMRQAERRTAKPQPAPEPWEVMVLVEELLALQSVALDGVDDAWLYEYMESQGKRTNRTLDRRTFDAALSEATRRQIADNERLQRLENARNAAIAADAQQIKPTAAELVATVTSRLQFLWARPNGGEVALRTLLDELEQPGFPYVGSKEMWRRFETWYKQTYSGEWQPSMWDMRTILRGIAPAPVVETAPEPAPVLAGPAPERGRQMEFERKLINQGKTVKLYGRNVDGTLTVTVDASTVHLYSPGMTLTRDDTFTLLRMIKTAQQELFDPKEMSNA